MDVSVYFADVVEVTVGYRFLRGQLAQLVQEDVKLELGGEIAQPLIAKRFPENIHSFIFKVLKFERFPKQQFGCLNTYNGPSAIMLHI